MSGIDRLRTLAGEWDAYGLGGALEDVAGQIEREQGQGVSRTRVMAVLSDMERHVLGHEGAWDSPVARWARELREALKSDTSDSAEHQKPSCAGDAEAADVTLGAAKVTTADRDAIAWVREHGGLERVKAQRRESIPRAAYERKKAGFLDHIAECETALGKRRESIARLADENDALRLERAQMRPRLMPEGMEWLIKAWPRFEDEEPVKFGDMALIDGEADMVEAVQLWIHGRPVIYGDGGSQQLERGERVKRPAKVLDADGVEICVGDTVYHVGMSTFDPEYNELTVTDIRTKPGLTPIETKNSHNGYLYGKPEDFTHRAPVPAADGKPLREGETVFDKDTGDRFEVNGFSEDGFVVCWDLDKCEADIEIKPSQLTHERPVVDTWERLEEDAGKRTCEYFGQFSYSTSCDGCPQEGFVQKDDCRAAKAADLVRRARALAERDA